MPSSGSGPAPAHDTQLQRTRADIKNILPIDLYECMGVVSIIISSTIYGRKYLLPRYTERFYQLFFALFQFTSHLISDDLQRDIKVWFRAMPGRYKDTEMVLAGTDLYIRFYRELSDYGIVTLFEGVIQPNFTCRITKARLLQETDPRRRPPEVP